METRSCKGQILLEFLLSFAVFLSCVMIALRAQEVVWKKIKSYKLHKVYLDENKKNH